MSKNGVKRARDAQNIHIPQLPEKRPTARKKGVRRRRRRLPAYLTVPETQRFFAAVKSPRDRAIFRLMYHHGLRVSEIGLLRYSDYRPGSSLQLDRCYIRRLKGSISGETAVIPAAAVAVRAWLRMRGHLEGPLFPSRQRGPIGRRRLEQLMLRYCQMAGIPREKAHPHAWKHTCCTQLISDQGEGIINVQRHVGHADIRSTMIYAELTDEANEARARRLREWH